MSSSAPSISVALGQSMSETSSPSSKAVMKHVDCVQLEKDNYYSWEVQFSAMLHDFDLIGYVEGSVELTSSITHQ